MELSELVEDLMAYIPLPASGSRVRSPEACLNFQPGRIQAFANVSAVRATERSLDRVSQHATRFFADCGRQDFTWFVGPRTRPRNPVDALTSLGAVVLSDCAAMVLDHAPPPMDGVEIRQVTTREQLLIYRRIGVTAELDAELTIAQQTELDMTNDAAWQDYTSYAGRRLNYLAFLDTEPVSAAGLLLTDHGVAVLSGAATLPRARGRGLYRALVHARWLVADRRAAGPLAVQASNMSSPVLARVGFERLAEMTILRQQTAPMECDA